MTETIFKKILKGDIPCYKVYEDSLTLAFLDVQPLSLGHTLVIPKEEAESLDQLSDRSSEALGKVLPRICRAIMQVTGTQAYNILQNNGPLAHQAVAHVHFHIIPKPNEKEGLGIKWPSGSLAQKEGETLSQKIRSAIT